MTRHASYETSVSALLGAVVTDSSGRKAGIVRELVVSPAEDANHIHAVLLLPTGSSRGAKLASLPVSGLERRTGGGLYMRPGAATQPSSEDDRYLLMDRDVLDQQIIDVHGHKVVRVNDVELVWEPVSGSANGSSSDAAYASLSSSDQVYSLRIAEVEVGLRGAMRRLLKGLPPSTVDRISARFKTSVIPWDFVDLIDRDPARRVKLKIEQDRLAKMHPSDLADILEELAPAERQALFTSLDEEVAAETLEEVEPRVQQELTESLDSEQVAGIVEEMDPAAAADFLAKLTNERSEAILEEMDPEGRQEVEDLLEFSGDSAAGQMTTDYISLPESAQIGEAIRALREYEGDRETLTHIFLVDEQEELKGVVPLVQLLMAGEHEELRTLTDGHIVWCDTGASGKRVAELFDKYNLRALPVLDEEHRLAGVVYAEQVIAQLRKT